MKGIVLAGGTGSRLYPATLGVSKQLLPVYDKPMVYYPLSVLMLAGIREILLITTPEQQAAFQRLLGDGSHFGIQLQYAVQPKPNGIAEALLLGEKFINGEPVCLILGDNIFYGHGFSSMLHQAAARAEKGRATVFGYAVADPQRFGVMAFNQHGHLKEIIEKPAVPPSAYAVTGLYFYDGKAASKAAELTPSERGELEITDLNQSYLSDGLLYAELLGRGFAWLDTGTPDSLMEAAQFVHTIEIRQGLKIACLEEIAYRQGWINTAMLRAHINRLHGSDYGRYLTRLLEPTPFR